MRLRRAPWRAKMLSRPHLRPSSGNAVRFLCRRLFRTTGPVRQAKAFAFAAWGDEFVVAAVARSGDYLRMATAAMPSLGTSVRTRLAASGRRVRGSECRRRVGNRPARVPSTLVESGHCRTVETPSRHHANRPCRRFHFVRRGAVSAMHSTKFSAASMNLFSASVLMPRRSLSLNLPKT